MSGVNSVSDVSGVSNVSDVVGVSGISGVKTDLFSLHLVRISSSEVALMSTQHKILSSLMERPRKLEC